MQRKPKPSATKPATSNQSKAGSQKPTSQQPPPEQSKEHPDIVIGTRWGNLWV